MSEKNLVERLVKEGKIEEAIGIVDRHLDEAISLRPVKRHWPRLINWYIEEGHVHFYTAVREGIVKSRGPLHSVDAESEESSAPIVPRLELWDLVRQHPELLVEIDNNIDEYCEIDPNEESRPPEKYLPLDAHMYV